VVVVASLDVMAVLSMLALYKPQRFHRAGRAVTGMVVVGFLLYLAYEITRGNSRHIGSRSGATPWSALFGLLFIGIPCLRYTIVGRFGWRREVVLGIRRFLSGPCPNCGSSLAEHDWAMFATTVAGEKNTPRLTEFFAKIKERDWRSVGTFADWDPIQNDMEVYAVRCVSGGVVFVLRNPFELYESDELYLRETISAAEIVEIEKLIPSTSWQKGPSAADMPDKELA
jgi:hypothetical protein